MQMRKLAERLQALYNRRSREIRRMTATVLAVAVLATASFAVSGTTTASSLRVRAATSTDSEILGNLPNGSQIEVLGQYGNWYAIQYNGKTAYVSADYVKLSEVISNSTGTVTGSVVNVRASASTGSNVLTKLVRGTEVKLLGYENGWYKISYGSYTGYMCGDYVSANVSGTTVATASTISATRQKVVNLAMSLRGIPYVYGGSTTSGFDCSGLVQYVFRQVGISLYRTSASQYTNGVAVAKADLLPGDLVFFSRSNASVGHVGIYIGDGQFIHAPAPGGYVCVESLSTSYYVSHYVGARRVID